jgi:hypothetical protein
MHRRMRVACLSLLAFSVLPSAASAARPCHVADARSERGYTTLQQAVDVARAGDALSVSGSCHGDTVIEKDLTISGKHDAALDGAGMTHHVVLVGGGANVSLSDLTIQNGIARFEPGSYVDEEGDGGGIVNLGRLTLEHVVVRNNEATAGNPGEGPVSERAAGGGIFDLGELVLEHSAVVGNRAAIGAGIYANGYGVHASIKLIHSSVACNSGGGIQDEYGVSLTLSHSQVDEVRSYGGSTLTANDSTIGPSRCER